jgi:SAM-dependent methyltransferase
MPQPVVIHDEDADEGDRLPPVDCDPGKLLKPPGPAPCLAERTAPGMASRLPWAFYNPLAGLLYWTGFRTQDREDFSGMPAWKAFAKSAARKVRNLKKQMEGTDDLSIREFVASRFLKGQGIEIGALDKPMPLPKGVGVKYVDRLSTADLIVEYPELKGRKLVQVDIVDDGQVLGKVPPESADFVIANHFLEHCGDPLRSLENMFRVLRPSGMLFLTIPDKRFTFDRNRPVTDFAHVLKDYREGPETSRRGHYEEWVRSVENVVEPERARQVAEQRLGADYSIHFHVWSQKEMLEFFLKAGEPLGLGLELELFMKNGEEMIAILSKGEPAGQALR